MRNTQDMLTEKNFLLMVGDSISGEELPHKRKLLLQCVGWGTCVCVCVWAELEQF